MNYKIKKKKLGIESMKKIIKFNEKKLLQDKLNRTKKRIKNKTSLLKNVKTYNNIDITMFCEQNSLSEELNFDEKDIKSIYLKDNGDIFDKKLLDFNKNKLDFRVYNNLSVNLKLNKKKFIFKENNIPNEVNQFDDSFYKFSKKKIYIKHRKHKSVSIRKIPILKLKKYLNDNCIFNNINKKKINNRIIGSNIKFMNFKPKTGINKKKFSKVLKLNNNKKKKYNILNIENNIKNIKKLKNNFLINKSKGKINQ